ncbi:MAG: FkbM family methyltransferase [Thaumarchaeota archaeon]|nr:FkbM family methyltransferase [Nitrososphaerota archaeon]
MSSVFLNRVYGSSFQRKTIVDAGVYNGDSAIFFSINGARQVVGIEPLRENLELARRNIGLNNLGDRIKLVEAALSGSEGFVRFKCYPHLPNAGEINNSDDATGQTIEVKAVTVGSVMRDFKLPKIDLLKMNCEGAEYDVIESLSKQTANLIDEIRLEFHSGPEKLIPILERLGYSISGEKYSIEADGQLVASRNQLRYNLASPT